MADMLKLFPYLNMEFMEEPKGWKAIHTKLVDYDLKVMQGMLPHDFSQKLIKCLFCFDFNYFNF